MTIDEKLDKVLNEISEIKTHIAVSEVKRDDFEKRITHTEKGIIQYKNDRAKAIGASGILAVLAAWITKHF